MKIWVPEYRISFLSEEIAYKKGDGCTSSAKLAQIRFSLLLTTNWPGSAGIHRGGVRITELFHVSYHSRNQPIFTILLFYLSETSIG